MLCDLYFPKLRQSKPNRLKPWRAQAITDPLRTLQDQCMELPKAQEMQDQ